MPLVLTHFDNYIGTLVVILRAATGVRVWSAGHDVRELPEDGHDPLAYHVPLERLLRRVQDFPAPVMAMIEGSVGGEPVTSPLRVTS